MPPVARQGILSQRKVKLGDAATKLSAEEQAAKDKARKEREEAVKKKADAISSFWESIEQDLTEAAQEDDFATHKGGGNWKKLTLVA